MHDNLRKAASLTMQALDGLSPHIGMTTKQIDDYFVEFCNKHGAHSATLGYKGFPMSCCTSVNHVVAHGIPNDNPLRDGDIVNVDFSLVHNGYFGDSSRMFIIGKPSVKARRIIRIAYLSMWAGITAVKPGNHVGDIGHAIELCAKSQGGSVVREFGGHGIGTSFHMHPTIPNYGIPGEGPLLEPGWVFTVEPIVNLGKPDIKVLSDNWTAVTRDKSLSAQWEHMVLVTDIGYEVLT